LIAFIITVIAIISVAFIPSIKGLLGILFLFLVPGYSLVSALFPGNQLLGIIERFAFSLAASIALVCLTGVVLNYTPLGVNLGPAMIIVSVLSFGLLAVAFIRRLKLTAFRRFSPAAYIGTFSSKENRVAISVATVVILGLAAGSIIINNQAVQSAGRILFIT